MGKMFLFSILTFLTFISSFASKIVTFVIKLLPYDNAVEKMSVELIQLKKELNLISMVDEFAKHAKIQRKIIKLEEEKKGLVGKHTARMSLIKNNVILVIYGITYFSLLFMVWMYRGETVAKLPEELLWPVPHIFNWFSDTSGCISIPSWIVISSSAFKVLAKNF